VQRFAVESAFGDAPAARVERRDSLVDQCAGPDAQYSRGRVSRKRVGSVLPRVRGLALAGEAHDALFKARECLAKRS
jgi:hypothetical protein